MPRILSLILLLATASGAFIVASSPREAMAYRQTKTCVWAHERDPAAPTLVPDCQQGETAWPVSWPERQITYMINDQGDESFGGLPFELEDAIRQGVEEWNAPECSDFAFVYGGKTSIARHDPKDRVNIISFIQSGWPDTSAAIALTTTTMTPRGVLVDADIEFNSKAHDFTITDDRILVDVRNATAHEAGHLLGLDHTAEADATMYFEAPDGEVKKRDLHPDDIAGVCTMYSSGVPNSVYEDEIDQSKGCCAILPSSSPRGPERALLLLAIVCLVGARRERRARR